jgi:metal-responsive CopG/Arc/MetJ family transcriptional regulator
MKIAISLPDALFQSADELAERMGVSRSELYARAVADYLAKHRAEDVTARLNQVFGEEPSGMDERLRKAQSRSLSSSEW